MRIRMMRDVAPERHPTCHWGFHRWVTSIDDLGDRCFACPRCGRVDPDNDTRLATYAMAYGFGGRQPLPHWWTSPRSGASTPGR